MSRLTPQMQLFMKTEQMKKQLMRQGMTKQEALKTVQTRLAEQLPETMLVGIENDHITIRRAQNKPENMGEIITRAFGGKDQALKMLDNIKKASASFAASQSKEDQNDRGDTDSAE